LFFPLEPAVVRGQNNSIAADGPTAPLVAGELD